MSRPAYVDALDDVLDSALAANEERNEELLALEQKYADVLRKQQELRDARLRAYREASETAHAIATLGYDIPKEAALRLKAAGRQT